MNKENTIDSKSIYSGKIVQLKVDTVEIVGKGYAQREIISHRGGVCCIAVTEANKIVLVRQFRKAVEQELLELPAGTLEVGETPKQAIIRELKEETGYHFAEVESMVEFFPSPGYKNELGHLFVGKAVNKGEMELDGDEEIEVEEFTLDELLYKINQGEIKDAKTILGICMYQLFLDKKIR